MRTRQLLQVSLFLSALTTVQAGDGYPPFSWDRVPVSAHLGIRDGLEPEQYDFLAEHFDFITFTGGKIHSETIEPNIAAGARAIKKRNPHAKVLFYWYPCQRRGTPERNNWQLFFSNLPDSGYMEDQYTLNVTRQDVRDWWTDWAAKAVTEFSCDGLFLDGLCAGQPGFLWSRRYGDEKAAEMDKAMIQMMKEAREKVGPDKLFIFNELHAPYGFRYLKVTDGAMIADFDRGANIKQQPKEDMANNIEAMSKAAKEGKIVIFKGWPGFTWWSDKEMLKKPHEEIHRIAKERITFPLASFLVGAGPNCYFCYTWGWLGEYGTYDWYPEFDQPLGAPKGDAIRKGWTYHREFEHASVFVDLDNKTARIDWK